MDSFSKSFIGSDNLEVHIDTKGDYVFLNRHCKYIHSLCRIEDIGRVIEILQEAKEAMEVVCEFILGSTRYRILNKKGTYTLCILNSACIPEDPDNWYPFKQQIGSELLNAIVKALMEKK